MHVLCSQRVASSRHKWQAEETLPLLAWCWMRYRYRRLALKFHPEISKDGDATTEFNRICEAYDVLSDRECVHMGGPQR